MTKINMACVSADGTVRRTSWCLYFFISLIVFLLRPRRLKKTAEKKLKNLSKKKKVDPRHFHILADWRRAYTLEKILVDLRQEMSTPANRKLAQPAEGSTYE